MLSGCCLNAVRTIQPATSQLQTQVRTLERGLTNIAYYSRRRPASDAGAYLGAWLNQHRILQTTFHLHVLMLSGYRPNTVRMLSGCCLGAVWMLSRCCLDAVHLDSGCCLDAILMLSIQTAIQTADAVWMLSECCPYHTAGNVPASDAGAHLGAWLNQHRILQTTFHLHVLMLSGYRSNTVWMLSGCCLGAVWMLSGCCLNAVWMLSIQIADAVWMLS
jgi:hypothetical protein